jgi:amino acid permease
VVVGTVIAASLITVFGVMVWGASTMGVSEDAVSGLSKSVGPWIGTVGSLLGLLSVTTAFMTIAVNTKEMFVYDVRLKHTSAWLLAMLVPLLIALSGVANVISVISFSGALFGGVTAIMICILYLVAMKKTQQSKKLLRFPRVLTYTVMIILLIGALGKLLI